MPSTFAFYQFFYPDDVVSAVLFTELCAGLVQRGWNVTAFPSIREYRDESKAYVKQEEFEGIRINRIWRPAWRQSSGPGRILNAVWMILRWSILAVSSAETPDVILVGTDPILSVLIAIAWRRFRPNTIIAHWCFDLYPEAAFAEGVLHRRSWLSRILLRMLKKAYSCCDLIVNIGPCMRELLNSYGFDIQTATLVPWALEEPGHVLAIPPAERKTLFGDAKLGILYAGSFGRAHSFDEILTLARLMKHDSVHLTFSVRGNREGALRDAVRSEDRNIGFVPFAASDKLEDRLGCADIHVVSLREEWTGTIVPSKLFGALAVGRPLLFCGSPTSSVARWIEQFNLGWVLTKANADEVAVSIRAYMNNPADMVKMNRRCQEVYKQNFSREKTLNEWHRLLTELVSNRSIKRSEIPEC